MNRENGAREAGLVLILKDFVHYRQRSLNSLLWPCETSTGSWKRVVVSGLEWRRKMLAQGMGDTEQEAGGFYCSATVGKKTVIMTRGLVQSYLGR